MEPIKKRTWIDDFAFYLLMAILGFTIVVTIGFLFYSLFV